MAPRATAIIVDNASTDDTVNRAQAGSGVRVIANHENRGFAAAVNQGVRDAADSEYFLILNPDVQLLMPIDPLVEAARRYGLAAGRLLGEYGRTQSGFTVRRFPTPAALASELFGINRLWRSNPINRKYRYLDRDLEQPGPVDQPAGAFLMFRRDVWEKLGGFDEQFHPLWFEDVDFCRRAANAGYQSDYVPSVTALHKGGHSVRQIPAGRRASYWYVSLLRYAAKHYSPLAFRGICVAVLLSSIPRIVVDTISERTAWSLISYLKIMRFAGFCLVSPRSMNARAWSLTT